MLDYQRVSKNGEQKTHQKTVNLQLQVVRWGDMDISSPLALLPEDGYRAPGNAEVLVLFRNLQIYG